MQFTVLGDFAAGIVANLSNRPLAQAGLSVYLPAVRQRRAEASWRSGYAEDCKSLHPGSIPGEASIFPFLTAVECRLLDPPEIQGSDRLFSPSGRLFSPFRPRSGLPFRRSIRTTRDLRHRLTDGRSWDSTRSPTGTIQKPRTGRKPRMPPQTRLVPTAIRAVALRGSFSVFEPNRISPRPASN